MVIREREEIEGTPEEESTILGVLGEREARKEYGLQIPPGGRTSWHDAEYQNGKPVSIKSAQPDRRFRVFEESHDVLTSQNGYYVFVAYKPVTVGESFSDSKIEVVGMKRKRATDVTKLVRKNGGGWNLSGHERGRQHKIQVEEVFPGEGVAEAPSDQ